MKGTIGASLAAVAHLRKVRLAAEWRLPALVAKIDYALWCAGERQNWSAHDPLPVFDLDARYRPLA
jgi:hypothetical protein